MSVAVIDENAEHVRASWWRRRIMLLKVDQLDAAIGIGWRNIYRFETGELNDTRGFQRYKMACAGLHAQKYGWQKGRQFDWRL